MHAAALFYTPTCGFCRKVFRYMEDNNVVIPLKNVNENSQVRQELITIAGKTQVPCLVVDGRPIHESDDIIDWLDTNWNKDDHTRNTKDN